MKRFGTTAERAGPCLVLFVLWAAVPECARRIRATQARLVLVLLLFGAWLLAPGQDIPPFEERIPGANYEFTWTQSRFATEEGVAEGTDRLGIDALGVTHIVWQSGVHPYSHESFPPPVWPYVEPPGPLPEFWAFLPPEWRYLQPRGPARDFWAFAGFPCDTNPPPRNDIYYVHNALATRADSQSGFSAPFRLSDDTSATAIEPDAAVEADGTVHVVWVEIKKRPIDPIEVRCDKWVRDPQNRTNFIHQRYSVEQRQGNFAHVHYRRRSPSAAWSGAQRLFAASVTQLPDFIHSRFPDPVSGPNYVIGTPHLVTTYRRPLVAINAPGQVAVACRKEVRVWNTFALSTGDPFPPAAFAEDTFPPPDTNSFSILVDSGSSQFELQAPPVGEGEVLYHEFEPIGKLVLSDAGVAHLAYVQATSLRNQTNSNVFHTNRWRIVANGTIDPLADVALEFQPQPVRIPGVVLVHDIGLRFAVGPAGEVHVAYRLRNSPGGLVYGIVGGPYEWIPDTYGLRPQDSLWVADLLVDEYGQPHVIDSAGCVNIKLRRPEGGFRWTVVCPSGFNLSTVPWEARLVHRPARFAALARGFFHFLGFGYYARGYEHNLGAQSGGLMFSAGPAMSVNIGNGNLFGAFPLFASRGPGIPCALTLYHNSQEAESCSMGPGWTHSYDISLTPLLHFGDGRQVGFARSDDFLGRIVADSPSARWTTVITKHGFRYIFFPSGRLSRLRDSNGNELTCEYSQPDGQGQLTRVVDSVGRVTSFSYDARGFLDTIVDPGQRQYKLGYDANNLVRIRLDATGLDRRWEFEYSAANNPQTFERKGLLRVVRTPRGAAASPSYGTTYEYTPDGRLLAVLDPPENVVVDEVNLDAQETLLSDSRRRVNYYYSLPGAGMRPFSRFEDRRGHRSRAEYEPISNVGLLLTDPLGFSVTREFTTYRLPAMIQDKRRAWTVFRYSGPCFGGEGLSAEFPANLQKIYLPKSLANDPFDPETLQPPIQLEYTRADTSDELFCFNDDLNRVSAVTDAKGNRTQSAYDSFGNLQRASSPLTTLVDGTTEAASNGYGYTTMGRLQSATNAAGGLTQSFYDEPQTGLVTEILEDGQPRGQGTRYTYDLMGNVRTMTLPPNNGPGGTWEYFYDTADRLIKVADPLGHETVSFYDADDNLIAARDARGAWTTNVWDKLGRLKSVITPAGTHSYAYDREGNLRRYLNPRGCVTKLRYDALGRVVERREPGGGKAGGGGPAEHILLYAYDPNGNLTNLTSWPDRSVRYEYDARNNLTQVFHPLGNLTDELFYDDNDDVVAAQRRDGTNFWGGVLRFFDERDRVFKLVQLTQPYRPEGTNPGPAEHILYNSISNFVRAWNANGDPLAGLAHSMTSEFDKRGRLFCVRDGLGTVVREQLYYEDNSLRSLLAPNPAGPGLTTNAHLNYNPRGEVMQVLDALNQASTFQFDPNGNLTKAVDRLGKSSAYQFDAYNRLIKEVQFPDSLRIETAYGYDPNSNLTNLCVFNPGTGRNDACYVFHYDEADRVEKMVYPTAPAPAGPMPQAAGAPPPRPEVWTYNEHGELETYADANGQVQTQSYDALGRLREVRHEYPPAARNRLAMQSPASDPQDVTISYDYDDAGNLGAVFDGRTRIVNRYDPLSRLTNTVTTVLGARYTNDLSYGYFASGHRQSMRDPTGALHEYRYNPNDLLEEIQRNQTSYARWTFRAGWEPEMLAYKNGLVTHYGYTPRGEIESLRTWKPSPPLAPNTVSPAEANPLGELVAGFFYAYDPRGQRVALTREHLGEQIAYAYDDAGRLTGELSSGSDAAGLANLPAHARDAWNRAAATRGAPLPSSPVSFPPRDLSWGYDNAGNRTREVRDGDECVCLFDRENRLLSRTVFVGLVPRFRLSASLLTNGTQRVFRLTVAGGPDGPISIQRSSDLTNWSSVASLQLSGGLAEYRETITTNLAHAFYRAVGQPGRVSETLEYAYDSNGNMIGRRHTAADGAVTLETFGFDHLNRLVSFQKPGLQFGYLFGPDGNRLSKRNVTADTTDWFLYDGLDVVADYSQSGPGDPMLQASYVQDLALDSKLVRIDADGTEHHYVSDTLGSVTRLLGGDQSVEYSEVTDAWGNTVASAGTVQDRHGFTQRERDDGSGLIHYRARAYDPQLGRFVQRDLLLNNRIFEHYTYVGNSPTDARDPRGLLPVGMSGLDSFGRLTSMMLSARVRLINPDAEFWATEPLEDISDKEFLRRLIIETPSRRMVDSAVNLAIQSAIRYSQSRSFWDLLPPVAFAKSWWEGKSAQFSSYKDQVGSDQAMLAVLDRTGREVSGTEKALDVLAGQSDTAITPFGMVGGRPLGRMERILLTTEIAEEAVEVFAFAFASQSIVGAALTSSARAATVVARVPSDVPSWGYDFNKVFMNAGRGPGIDPRALRWVQRTAGGSGRTVAYTPTMEAHGWLGDPIDVVLTPEGLVTVDHTRAAITLALGRSNIPYRLHFLFEPLAAELMQQLPADAVIGPVMTWGDVIMSLARRQKPPLRPFGTPVPPRLMKGEP